MVAACKARKFGWSPANHVIVSVTVPQCMILSAFERMPATTDSCVIKVECFATC